MNSCLTDIIGFSQSDCDCFTDQFESGYDESTSGLYMDQLPETEHILPAVKNMADCAKTMTSHFSRARQNALAEFNEKLMEAIGTRYKVRQDPFVGQVGQNSYTANVSTSSTWIGAVYEMRPYKGGRMRVKKVLIGLNQTVSPLPVRVYKAYVINGIYEIQELVTTLSLQSTANATHTNTLATPLDLPMADDSSHVIHYLFLIDRTAGFLPKNYPVKCGCSKQTLIEKWIYQAGIQGNDHEALLYSQRKTGTGDYINGIVCDVELKCGDTEFICENYNRSPYLETAINHAILYQAASNLLKSILRADEVNRFTLTKREQMANDSLILHNKFKSRIDWIAENMDLSTNSCFICNTLNESHGPYKAGIRF